MSETETTEAVLVKIVLLIDYSLGGKEAYLQWIASIAPVIIGPPELKASASYDNHYGESPHRLVEFEFAAQEDAAAYHALEEVIQTTEAELERSNLTAGSSGRKSVSYGKSSSQKSR